MTSEIPVQESELVVRCQKGDLSAFEELFYRYQSDAYNIAYGLMGNVEDAKDMTQEAFVRAYEKIHQFQRRSSFRTWIAKITTNLCLDELRKRQRRRTESLEAHPDALRKPTHDPSALERLLQQERVEKLQQILHGLPEKYRVILVLRDIQGYSYEEIAQILGCSLGRVKSRLHEARQELKHRCLKSDVF